VASTVFSGKIQGFFPFGFAQGQNDDRRICLNENEHRAFSAMPWRWETLRSPFSLRENGTYLRDSLYIFAENVSWRVIKLVLEYPFFLRVSFRPERSGVEESAVLPVLSASVEKQISPLRLSR
jgi:hypothetical protein